MKQFIATLVLLVGVLVATAQTFDMTRPQPRYSEATGYGYDVVASPTARSVAPFYFSVRVPDGNYRVTVTLGSNRRAAETMVRAESRRLMVERAVTRKGHYQVCSFIVNKRSPRINDKEQVKIKAREKDYFTWDDRLTLEFNGPAPAVRKIVVEPDTVATTVFLCGNSTVVDQHCEPWASWGQMIPRWFDDRVAVSNHAESGLTAGSFLASNRLDKVLAMIRPGDYVFCEFGHNDQKERGAGTGAWYNFAHNLKIFIDRVRAAGATVVFLTPTQRRAWNKDSTHIVETHGDYPDAMRSVARREQVPVIELHDMTRTFFEALGFEGSKRALVHYPMGTLPGQTRALADNTHFNPYGAYEVAKMVVMGMKALRLPLVEHLQPDWRDYDPARPDDFQTFRWAPSVITEFTKPDGN